MSHSDNPVQPHHFRVRPWPIVLGGSRDLALKRAKHPTPAADNHCASFAEMVDHLESTKNGAVHRLDLRPSWRERLWMHCEGSGESNDFMSEDADDEFLDLHDEMRLNDEWNLGHRPRAAERELLEWLMEHDLSSLEILLDDGFVGIGDIFDPCTLEWQSFGGGEPESLLAMAAKHVCVPEAVCMLLARGADPNSGLVHLSFNGGYLPTCGPGGLAVNDVDRHWCDGPKKLQILTALGEAGGEMLDAALAYHDRDDYAEELKVCDELYALERKRRETDVRQCLETIVAALGIVNFWRRVAAAPDSKAMKHAAKRFCAAQQAQSVPTHV
jgi:hypothetical protein